MAKSKLQTAVEPVNGTMFKAPKRAKSKKESEKSHADNDLFEATGTHATDQFSPIRDWISGQPIHIKVSAINAIRSMLHDISPFKDEPVDYVEWVRSDKVEANDYNPNSVAPPEMKLLEHSITEDGYTQPIVSWQREDVREVVDGFHRNRVGKESESVRLRLHGYLPVVTINAGRLDKGDRISATIRHNRARGKHQVQSMSDIVIELKKRNWSDSRIGKELGMDEDEILRLCQISGLSEVFADEEFSEAWDAAIFVDEVPDAEVELESPEGD